MSADVFEAELIPDEVLEAWVDDDFDVNERRERRQLDFALVSTGVVVVVFCVLSAIWGVAGHSMIANYSTEAPGSTINIEWGESVFMPRDPDCIDAQNGQDLPEYGIGYEPSLAIDGHGNMFITAHKDLRWSSPDGGLANPLSGEPHIYPDGACLSDYMTSWDYFASWFWITNDNGTTWTRAANFEETPGTILEGQVTNGASGSACLGDEGDIAVDAVNRIYYLDTYLEDNWIHVFSDGGNTFESNFCDRQSSMAADDRPWIQAQNNGIVHYLGNSGVSIQDCENGPARYWYYRSDDGGQSWSQCFSMPGGWSTIAPERSGDYVFVAQENQDTATGHVQVRISSDTGLNWGDPINVGPRDGNPPEGYPLVETNGNGTVAVVWADCPNGKIGAWEIRLAMSYDRGETWETWNITPDDWEGITMYPFVSISEDNITAVSFYGIPYDNTAEGGYVAGQEWYLYTAAVREPHANDTFNFEIAAYNPDGTPEVLHTVTQYEEDAEDVHALHDFFETVISPDGTWMGIAYQQNIGEHPFEDNEEQRYIKFIRGDFDL
ncbi:MAG: sialidase family protein [Candidatus Thalassarchaeaceae archaeon]|nr:sialidase family protein [Candidatus Thalassarchaeaceae archaeon]